MEERKFKNLEEKKQELEELEQNLSKKATKTIGYLIGSFGLSILLFLLTAGHIDKIATLIITVIPSIAGVAYTLINTFKSELMLDEKKKEVFAAKKQIETDLLDENTRKLSIAHKKALNEIVKDNEFSSFVSGVLDVKNNDKDMFNKVKDVLKEELDGYEQTDVLYFDSEFEDREKDKAVVNDKTYKKGSKK